MIAFVLWQKFENGFKLQCLGAAQICNVGDLWPASESFSSRAVINFGEAYLQYCVCSYYDLQLGNLERKWQHHEQNNFVMKECILWHWRVWDHSRSGDIFGITIVISHADMYPAWQWHVHVHVQSVCNTAYRYCSTQAKVVTIILN